MQVSMKLEIRDSPGQLVAALSPISDIGGNIKAVIHEHEFESGDVLGVEVVIEIPRERLDILIQKFREKEINVLTIGEERFLYRQSVIMIGHLVHTDLGDTVDCIDRTGFAEVTHMNIAMPAINEPSSSQIVIKAITKDDMEKALAILRKVAKQKDFLLIEPLGADK